MQSSDPAVWRRAFRTDSSGTMWTFAVSRVYKGAVGEHQEIVTPLGGPGGGNCSGIEHRHPGTEPFLVFAYRTARDKDRLQVGQYASNICSGSRPLADGDEPVLGGLPARESGAPGSSPSPTRGGLAAPEPGGQDSSPTPASLVVGVGILAAAVAAGLGLATLKARRRARHD
jgi:hypothetical protein